MVFAIRAALPGFSGGAPQVDQEHECAGAAIPGGEAEDQGGGRVSERGEPGQPGHGGVTQGHGRLGVQALHGPALSPQKRNPQKSRLD